jgi:hypothetical protein
LLPPRCTTREGQIQGERGGTSERRAFGASKPEIACEVEGIICEDHDVLAHRDRSRGRISLRQGQRYILMFFEAALLPAGLEGDRMPVRREATFDQSDLLDKEGVA